MKPKETFQEYMIYDEIMGIVELKPEHHIMFGIMYNITSKGKNVLHKGVLTSSVNDILRQNLSRFNLVKKPKNAEWLQYLEELASLGYLRRLPDIAGLSYRPNGTVTIYNPNYVITDMGMELINQAMPANPTSSRLF